MAAGWDPLEVFTSALVLSDAGPSLRDFAGGGLIEVALLSRRSVKLSAPGAGVDRDVENFSLALSLKVSIFPGTPVSKAGSAEVSRKGSGRQAQTFRHH